MPQRPIIPKSGVNVQATPLLLEEGWSQSQLIRFKDGLLQKIGGWQKLNSTPFSGQASAIHPFQDLKGNDYLGIGTSGGLFLYSYSDDSMNNITPATAATSLSGAFSTTMGSAVITVNDPGAAVAVSDMIDILTAVYVGGLVLQGSYAVTALVSGGYQFNAAAMASSTVVKGGVTATYSTSAGTDYHVALTLGTYTFTNGDTFTVGVKTFVGGLTITPGPYTVLVVGGNASIFISSTVPVTTGDTQMENGGSAQIVYTFSTSSFSTSLWSLDNWGEDLIANIDGGGLFVWIPPVAGGNIATQINSAPTAMSGMFVALPQQQIVAYGCTDPLTALTDPMLVRWCNIGDYTDWTASATNQAGSYRLPIGNKTVGGISSNSQLLIWTDLDLWIGQYINFPLVYGFNRVGRSCGLLGQKGYSVQGGRVWWIGQNEFYVYDGTSVQELPCTVWDFIFPNLDENYYPYVFFGTNSHFSEFFCFFPTVGSNGQCRGYVKYNYAPNGNVWDYSPIGSLARSAWADQSIVGDPLGADYSGYIQRHEESNDADGAAIDSWAVTGWISISEGTEYTLLKRYLPDMLINTDNATVGQVKITFYFTDYAMTAPDLSSPSVRVYGPYTIDDTVPYLWPMGRGRYFAMKIESNSIGVFWRMGRNILTIQQDGRR